MAFGGAGFALSYPLVEALATKLDDCIERYMHVGLSDFMLHLCLADLGVSLTHEKGFHQTGGRDCCDIVYTANTSVAEVKYRPYSKFEVIA
ncbi:hypothetical protein CJ030_MR3G005570 [Morella rubra]|uniref:Uncharacterized protein n=1 Tax=Morella rubra TaxID=262757 RepID=A0A6A1W5B2_9ROSI|nr:hypothetical protein CJ030_MR3G005570 [Morella rubra]